MSFYYCYFYSLLLSPETLDIPENPETEEYDEVFKQNLYDADCQRAYDAAKEWVDNKVNDYCYDVFVNRKTGTNAETYLYLVDLSDEKSTNTYGARKIRVSTVIESCTNNPGENKVFSGSFKGVGDFSYGTFNTSTKTFTETV